MTREEAIKIIESARAVVLANGEFDEAMRMAIEALKVKHGRWIPVSERLPKAEYGESDSVLVCFEDERQAVLYFDGGNWCYPTGETYISVNHKNGWHNKVVAWQPLPEPYKEGEQNG